MCHDHDASAARCPRPGRWCQAGLTLLAAVLLLLAPGCNKLRRLTSTRSTPAKPAVKLAPGAVPGSAAVPASTSATTAKSRATAAVIERLRLLAIARLDQKLEVAPGYDRAAATKALLRDKYKIDLDKLWPAGVPELGLLTEEQVVAALNQQLEAEADKLFPAAKRTALVAEAAARFPLIQVGDQIMVEVRSERSVTGKLQQIGPKSLVIAERTILLEDVVAPDPSSFDAAATARQREAVVRAGYDIPRHEWLKAGMAERLPAALHAHYFLRINDKVVRIDQFVAANVAPVVEVQAKAYNRQLELQLRQEVVKELEEEHRIPDGMTVNPPPWPDLPPRIGESEDNSAD